MSRIARVVGLAVLGLLFLNGGSSVAAADQWPADDHSLAQPRLESPWQVSFGAGLRLDESQGEQHQPNLSVQLLRFITDGIALRLDLGWTPEQRYYSSSEATTFTTSYGLRWQERQKAVSPFVELDLNMWYFRGEHSGESFSRRLGGIGAGLGVAIKSGARTRFDVGVRFVLNNLERMQYTDFAAPGLPPDPPESPWPDWGGYGYSGPSVRPLTNLGHLYVRYRFGL